MPICFFIRPSIVYYAKAAHKIIAKAHKIKVIS